MKLSLEDKQFNSYSELELRKLVDDYGLQEILGAIIDYTDIDAVLFNLSDICIKKSKDYLQLWGDKKLSKRWAKVAILLEASYKVNR